ncbi:MAG: serine/threonine-protein kinase [Planctomycetota bacterium]
MKPERYRRVREIFFRASELEGVERGQYLESECAGDDDLLTEVHRLLDARDLDTGELRPPGAPGSTGELLGRSGFEAREPEMSPVTDRLSSEEGLRLGDYEILSELATGGMGIVYRARQIRLNRIVALKMLRSGRLASRREIERFRSEAEAAARLDHPNIVPVYEVGEAEGRHFFSMKLIEGRDLARTAASFQDQPRRAASLLAQVARAVHYGHRRGILHRDLKPTNILLDESDRPFVADFGIAKRLDQGVHPTQTTKLLGTPTYMAPEQVQGGTRDVTTATDVYSLGVILYELLSGRPPFVADTPLEILERVRDAEPPPLRSLAPEIDRDLSTICHKCLAKEPSRRYASAAALADDLERWLHHEPIEARPVSLLERAWLVWRRKPLLASLIGSIVALVLLLLAGTTIALFILQDHVETADSRLRESLIANARVLRRSGEPGQRGESLTRLVEAAKLQSSEVTAEQRARLRNEMIASLARPELIALRSWQSPEQGLVIDVDTERAELFVARNDGSLEVRGESGEATWTISPPEPGLRAGDVVLLPGTDRLITRFDSGSRSLIVLWDRSTREPLFEHAIPRTYRPFAALPAGRGMIVAGQDGRLRAFGSDLKEPTWTVALEAPVTCISVRPEGDAFALILQDARTVAIRGIKGGELVEILPEYPAEIHACDWTSDGSRLAIACRNFRVYVHDLDVRRDIAVLTGHTAEATRVEFSEDGRWLLSYAWDETTRLWDMRTLSCLLTIPGRLVHWVPEARDQLFLLVGRTITHWQLSMGEGVQLWAGHTGKGPWTVAFSNDGQRMISGGEDGLRGWDLSTGTEIWSHEVPYVRFVHFLEHTWPAQYDPSPFVITRWRDGTTTRQVLTTKAQLQATVAPKRERIALALRDRVELYSERTGELLRSIPLRAGRDNVAISADERYLAVGSWHGPGAQVLDLETGELVAELQMNVLNIQVAFDPRGRWLSTGDHRGVHLWSLDDWRLVRSFEKEPVQSEQPAHLAFSSDGRLLALTARHDLIQILDTQGGEVLASLESASTHFYHELRFPPDRWRLYATSLGNAIEVWDLETLGRRLDELGLGSPFPARR